MAKKAKNLQPEEPRELTRKERRLNARDRERNRKTMLWVGGTVAAVLLVIIIGAIAEFVLKPNSAVASIGDTQIVTKDYWKRIYLQRAQLQNQYVRLQQLETQFGGQGIFTSQLNQIEATLASPFALGVDTMIEETVLAEEAAARGISVSDDEVEEALREEIAAAENSVTVPQATSTAEAALELTATAESWTPTPTATIDISSTITTTVELPTPEPAPTLPILTDETYQEGLSSLQDNLREIGNISLDEYREVIRARLLSSKLAEVIGEERVETTELQVNARHILLREIPPAPEPTTVPEGEPTPEPTATATEVPEGAPTPTPTPGPRTLDEARALAAELRQRIVDGEDFALIASEYSDDLSNANNGGDLGWFGAGRMVPAFEEAALALPVGEVSEPVETDFGIHLIEVLERDETRAKDENTIAQERQQAYRDWIQEQILAREVEREDINSRLPRDLSESPPINISSAPVGGQSP